MGRSRTVIDISARCPLYEHIVSTANGKIAGVQCRFQLCDNFGFDTSVIIKCRSMGEALDLKGLFCDDLYEACPYFKAVQNTQRGARKG